MSVSFFRLDVKWCESLHLNTLTKLLFKISKSRNNKSNKRKMTNNELLRVMV